MFLRARCWLVGAFSDHIQPRKTNYGNHTLELTSHCLTSDWQLKDCDTFCSMAYIFKGHLNNIRKWLFVFENIILPYTALLGTARLFILGNAAYTFLIWITFIMWIFMQAYTNCFPYATCIKTPIRVKLSSPCETRWTGPHCLK